MSQMGRKEVSNEGDTSVNNSMQGESRLAGKKVKLPLFDGEDPVAWITRAEIYFDVQNTPDEMRVKLSRLSMEGSTIHWFNLLMETEDELSWEKLKRGTDCSSWRKTIGESFRRTIHVETERYS
ncbi:pentatricopeptide repeat-containing protein [Trifolium pratense]|uniref:Pentatricopeptide repeat-containing protein n=1 Tax=Trifolium pratense TaxID=57577 RepID=A0A2K3M0P6_TRIPR|nr:pentatricopeptide repeat-containing protein [Trifolium pratense]